MRTEQANVEYFFRLLYELFFGGRGGVGYATLQAFFTQVWFWMTIVGYGFALVGLGIIIFASKRLFELRRREEKHYSTILVAPVSAHAGNERWQHIQALTLDASPSAWREAITEADIMLDDALTEKGVVGDTIGDKLKSAHLVTINDAWEAHKVRNQIAHEGSAFDLSEELAHRTIQHYEAVFRELGAI